MIVVRMPLPGPATVVVCRANRSILVDLRLSRDEAALAIAGVLPHVHPDIVDHWLDTAFERRRLPFSARHLGIATGIAMALMGLFTPHPSVAVGHHAGLTYRRAPIVLAVPGAEAS